MTRHDEDPLQGYDDLQAEEARESGWLANQPEVAAALEKGRQARTSPTQSMFIAMRRDIAAPERAPEGPPIKVEIRVSWPADLIHEVAGLVEEATEAAVRQLTDLGNAATGERVLREYRRERGQASGLT